MSLFSGYEHPWRLAIFILVWRGVQDYWSSPLIMGRGVKIHPGVVTVGVLAGGAIAGVAGMFLSIPVIAAVRIVWRHLQAPENAPAKHLPSPGLWLRGSEARLDSIRRAVGVDLDWTKIQQAGRTTSAIDAPSPSGSSWGRRSTTAAAAR